ncbi:hypothetical protein B0A48_18751 [Cryoendolithus antarcticus]|uniref:Azaphilone pigments biosynthesis cluster protein L N-terminal domain-containing protein n=1 Tax=Cryoendolithus antarcticus TaxID=1507870 RepID=A0A1V8S8N8_9PEZI|nr:hypothetical protein B0A48_18751 [Cryoendolithus antarcticus]
MADPISVTSGVIALVSFGLQTSKAIYKSIESLNNHTKFVRDLNDEVKGFQNVLEELEVVISDDFVAKFTSIRLPLFSCAAACQDFNVLIRECTPNTTDSHRSMRDWTRLQFKAGDINDFRSTLSAYKSTIQIAIGGINLFVRSQKLS